MTRQQLEPNGNAQRFRSGHRPASAGAVLCEVVNDWLRRAGGWPGPEVRRALVALALSEPEAVMGCPYLLRLVATTPDVAFVSRFSLRAVPAGETEMVTVAQAARLLGVRTDSVRAQCRRGALAGATRQGRGRWVIPAVTVHRYKESRQAHGVVGAGRNR